MSLESLEKRIQVLEDIVKAVMIVRIEIRLIYLIVSFIAKGIVGITLKMIQTNSMK